MQDVSLSTESWLTSWLLARLANLEYKALVTGTPGVDRVALAILWPWGVWRVHNAATHSHTIGGDQQLLTRLTDTILGSCQGNPALAGAVQHLHLHHHG